MQELALKKPFAQSPKEILASLQVAPEKGLSARQVAKRRRRFGKNRLRTRRARSALGILADQFGGIIVWLLAVAACLSFYLGDLPEGFAIVAVLAVNGAIGFLTEHRAVRSMEELQRIAQVSTRVRREGATRAIDAREIVPGDIVIIEAGDVITADLRLLEAANLQCDESVLTGESAPVGKLVAALGADTELTSRTNMAFKGTAVTRGSGQAVVVATGMATELGRISKLAEEAEPEVSPLEKRLDRLGQRLVWLTLVLATATAIAGIARGREVYGMIETGIALAVAAVPEGLPVVATLCLARGMWRMAQRNALIAKLSAVETLGATTVILTDKTGTLTENRMTVARYLFADADIAVDATRGISDLPFKIQNGPVDPDQDERLAWALRIGTLCNNAELSREGSGAYDSHGAGDPMELALLAVARKAHIDRRSLLDEYPEVEEYAFDPDLKMMATVHEDHNEYVVAVKGAPETVIERCGKVLTKGGGERPLDNTGCAAWAERSHNAASHGYRILALAMKRHAEPEEDPYDSLTLVGLVCLLDPLRSDVPDAIAACREAGVRVIMVTGDHADTATEIAHKAGLGDGHLSVIEGRELRGVDAEALGQAAQRPILAADVFARVSPETKLKLVSLYQRRGEIVAMTGDGVNDAPALKKADIGIAMGQRGTQVAREAAHMVLKDDAFTTIVAAMREGRIIFSNIRRFVVYLLSCNVSEVLVVGLAVGGGLPMPLLPLQILYLNLVTDVFPAFALGLGEADDGVMRRPPRDPSEPIVDHDRWLAIGMLGSLITIATLGAFAVALYWLRLPTDQSVTVSFVTLALAQLWNVFNVRNADGRLLSNEVVRNPYVWAALVLCTGLIALALWLPMLSDVMQLPNPGSAGLLLALVASLVPLIAGQAILTLGMGRLGHLSSA